MGSKHTMHVDNWKKENYEPFSLRFTKGTKKEVVEYAYSQGLTLREYILNLIQDDTGIDMRIHKSDTKNT